MSSTITLNDQQRLEDAFKKLGNPLSEYNFTNCYLFRKIHNYQLEDSFLKGVTRLGKIFFLPLEFPFQVSGDKSFFPITEEWKAHLDEKKFLIERDEGDDDYLFCRVNMATMAGRNLASRRNLIHGFERNYDPEIKPFSVPDAIQVLQSWSGSNPEADQDACLEALQNMQQLHLTGIIVYSGNEPLGFTLSQRLNATTEVIHFAKVKPGLKGVTPFLYRSVAKSLPEEVCGINLEQDLGIPELKAAKEAYKPHSKLPKYRLTLL